MLITISSCYWWLCFYCLLDDLLLSMFCGSSSVPLVGLKFVIEVLSDHTHLLFVEPLDNCRIIFNKFSKYDVKHTLF